MKSILLVEDDPFLTDIYTTKLREAGFLTEIATDGERALRRLSEKKFDLLLLDVVLPRVDGWKILSEIKKAPHQYGGEGLKIVILSNLGQREEVKKGLKLGATKYLIKAHYTPSEVVGEIKKVIK